jgi:hypothetical protein
MSYSGVSSYKGRVEYRMNGKWGSICAKGVTPKSAKTMCR